MSLTNPNKVVTEERLLDFYQGILPYLGGMPEALANKFSKGDLLSITEKVVGCHTNGKPIYQKTFTGNTSSSGNDSFAVNANNVAIDVGASVEAYVDIKGGVMCAGNNARFIPFGTAYLAINNSSNGNMWAMASALNNSNASLPNKIQIYTGNNSSILSKPYVLTVRYTKTTDSANSFKFGDENDYSTAEKIVGTWIDGKPIYQKTIVGTLPTTSTNGTEVQSVIAVGASVDKFIDEDIRFVISGSWLKLFVIASAPNYYAKYILKSNTASSNKNSLILMNAVSGWSGATVYATIQYTKTS